MKRLTEASTWAGFATLAQMGAAIAPQYAFAFHCVTALSGTLAGLIAEKSAA